MAYERSAPRAPGKSVEECMKKMLESALRDQFNGVGRAFISSLLEQGFTRDEVSEAVRALSSQYEVRVIGDVVKVYFGKEKRSNAPR
ncbi:hypothetical protein [Thermofilum pendens]|uniref:Uncharacterized protein n=1 Tax=Thermofilum pendens (strain DSM 2475 / Hrk 5) TaxID=368408 RepID=A1RWI9_THEPD|nr:hypothetical protein [Thermofilum pendens]ABL77569.1 hypothetical protein Tpen_0159 [Thermofilum pendens Hrk 5]